MKLYVKQFLTVLELEENMRLNQEDTNGAGSYENSWTDLLMENALRKAGKLFVISAQAMHWVRLSGIEMRIQCRQCDLPFSNK